MRTAQPSWLFRVLPWGVFALGGAGIAWIAGAVNVPAPPPGDGLGESLAPSLVLARVDRLAAGSAVRERLWLLDPAPLFLPTSGDVVGPAPEAVADRPGGEVARLFPPALSFTAEKSAREILRPAATPGAEATASILADKRWFDGLARRSSPAVEGATAVRVARVELYRVGEAGKVTAVDIAASADLPAVAWRPLELTVLVDVAGVVGQPVVASTSGVDEIDERIRSIVGRELLPTLRLRSGIYRIEVGP